jgi:hypothetical protein
MTEQGTMTKQEISSSIVDGMGFVFDLYNELASLLRYVQQGIESSDLSVGKPLNSRLSVPPAGRSPAIASKLMQTALGLIVQVEAEPDESEDDEDDEDDLAADDSDPEGSSRAREKIAVTAETQLIAVRATLYDPKKSKNTAFTPVLSGAVLTSITGTPVAGRRKKSPDATPVKPKSDFEVKAGWLSRLLRHVNPDLTQGHHITYRIPKLAISATVSGIIQQDLADFDTEDKLDGFVNSLVELANGVR